MEDNRKFVLQEINDLNSNIKRYYTGTTYKVNGEVYPTVITDVHEAKVYTSQGRAYRGVKILNDKCMYNTFEVLPLDYALDVNPYSDSKEFSNSLEEVLKCEANKTIEDKILEHIGDRLSVLNKTTKSRLEEEKQSSARNELKMILKIFQER